MGSDIMLEKLADPALLFIERLRLAVEVELDYWEDWRVSPNLTEHEFRSLVNHIPSDTAPTWADRKSSAGPHGTTGETKVFMFNFDVKLFSRRSRFFVKGYFFDADRCRGVTIQSFRKVPPLRSVLRNR
ncbi:MAG: hypothetical protein HY537_12880 [Deltaproteobacteria bacterium]|nr:hypothetical protein [Deltaproteobacteria bacterium]